MTDPNYLLRSIRELTDIGLHTGELTLGGITELCEKIEELDESCKAGNYPRDWIPF